MLSLEGERFQGWGFSVLPGVLRLSRLGVWSLAWGSGVSFDSRRMLYWPRGREAYGFRIESSGF